MGDIELKIWQEKQMERCLIENTINSVIEAYSVFPPQPPDLIPYNEPTENLEESAILMAISEHGLQQSNHPVQELCVRQERSGDSMEVEDSSRSNNNNNNNTAENDDDSSSSNSDHMNVMEAAVSLAIQKQGLSLLGPNR